MANKKQKFIYRDLDAKVLMGLLCILKKEGSLKVNGLGIFEIKKYDAMKVVNNLNGTIKNIPERYKLVYKPALSVKKYINNG